MWAIVAVPTGRIMVRAGWRLLSSADFAGSSVPIGD